MSNRFLTTTLAIAALAAAASGCATRRYVRNRTEPLEQKTADLDKRTAENAQKIGDLDAKTSREISRVDEKANAADAHAGDAARQANEALSRGDQAVQKAEAANALAESGLARTGRLEKFVDNIGSYQMSISKTVHFGFDKSTLNDEAKKELDDLANALQNTKKYVIEVQGFTDSTGPSEYNYALSEKRATAVVRYLTEKHQIPVYRVHTIGLGKDMPVEANNRREARKLSRRVEVKVYTAPDFPQTAQSSQQLTEPSSPAGVAGAAAPASSATAAAEAASSPATTP
jgi:OOP family OmpA-OmpF porin